MLASPHLYGYPNKQNCKLNAQSLSFVH
jgi:hypothetical protein